jgi:hypothetical protein
VDRLGRLWSVQQTYRRVRCFADVDRTHTLPRRRSPVDPHLIDFLAEIEQRTSRVRPEAVLHKCLSLADSAACVEKNGHSHVPDVDGNSDTAVIDHDRRGGMREHQPMIVLLCSCVRQRSVAPRAVGRPWPVADQVSRPSTISVTWANSVWPPRQ